jgi:hypothetical protein
VLKIIHDDFQRKSAMNLPVASYGVSSERSRIIPPHHRNRHCRQLPGEHGARQPAGSRYHGPRPCQYEKKLRSTATANAGQKPPNSESNQACRANATARNNAVQAASDAQHRAWNNQQDTNSRKIQGFSNYLLDQTVVQGDYRNTHSTDWNRTADALVKANPNRYATVDNPNYWKGTDFSR